MTQRIHRFAVLALLATLFALAAGARIARANGGEKVPQYVYKTIGERKLVVDVTYPDKWKASDQRPAVVFFSGGAWRSGGTSQFRSKAKRLGARVEIDVAEGLPHAFSNRSPWTEKTVASADRFLISLGYLSKQPRVKRRLSFQVENCSTLRTACPRRRCGGSSLGNAKSIGIVSSFAHAVALAL